MRWWTSPRPQWSGLKKAAGVLQYYSGKKKRHTLKAQVVIERKTLRIVCLATGKGRQHDFKVYKSSKVKLHPQTEFLGDRGFQGIHHQHRNSHTPYRKSKRKPLTPQQLKVNQRLASERIPVEHVIRRLKVFRVLKETYRHRRKRFGLRLHLIAGLYNFDLQIATSLWLSPKVYCL